MIFPPDGVGGTFTVGMTFTQRKHKKELTVFLWEGVVDGTYNAAERALRPAVVVSGVRRITALRFNE